MQERFGIFGEFYVSPERRLPQGRRQIEALAVVSVVWDRVGEVTALCYFLLLFGNPTLLRPALLVLLPPPF